MTMHLSEPTMSPSAIDIASVTNIRLMMMYVFIDGSPKAKYSAISRVDVLKTTNPVRKSLQSVAKAKTTDIHKLVKTEM